ncbi:DNA methyltransferase [Bifidobacterium pseudolongum subsp. globosum]|nr:DNA methyltransferase [Bifidobacterium pseudolongum subsp. globosum]RYQ06542.1 DNA methyltransferase [Bifidobacterium pseudolongum subsp. globosum]RYQ13337.1 DNA methyltransferase [Bifidobacterium pseudolongum subsp. globosum]RYQ66276.1 DNA methyltransferase [Bifidobacterium pseudolongum subsp. globosum]
MRWCSSAAMLRYMHVITGRFKGMPLSTPRAETRPTTDRTKEALFSRLESHGLLQDARVLDLFGGTGALGIEALSRGARELVVVESSAQAAQLIAQTLTVLRRHAGWQEGMSARVVHAKAERYAAKAKPGEPFDLVLIDPPYAFATADCERLLHDLTARGLVARFGAIVLERSTRTAPPAAPAGWVMADRRDYGETAVYTFRSQEYEQIVREQSEE